MIRPHPRPFRLRQRVYIPANGKFGVVTRWATCNNSLLLFGVETDDGKVYGCRPEEILPALTPKGAVPDPGEAA